MNSTRLFSAFRTKSLLVIALTLPLLQPASTWGEEASSKKDAQAIDFARDIAPLLARNCIACHNAKKPEGGLNLESHKAMLAGGDSGAAIVASKPADSGLLKRVVDTEDPMPPVDNSVGAKRLEPAEVKLLQQWIEAGALPSQATPATVMNWQAIPSQLSPIYALDTSLDGHYMAIGRGNTAQIVDLTSPPSTGTPARTSVESLIDPKLKLADGTVLEASDFDLVQSLAFSSDSQLLATGGFRTVKLWRRNTLAKQVLAGVSPGAKSSTFAPAGKRLASVVNGTGLELVDLATGQSHRFLQAHAAEITALLWLSDQRLLSADATGKLLITEADKYQTVPLQTSEGLAAIGQLTVLGQHVVALDQAGKVYQLFTDAGKSLVDAATAADMPVKVEPIAVPEVVTALAVTSQPEPTLLLALESLVVRRVSLDKTAGKIETLGEFKVDARAQEIEVSPDGQTVLTISTAGQAKLWKLASGEALASLDRDYRGTLQFRARQRDAARQTGFIALLATQLTELQKASAAEVEAHKKVLESRDQANTALATKNTELATAQAATSETEKALAAAQQRVTELTAELETKRKAATEAETKRKEAETLLAQREQALATAADGVSRAAQRIADMEKLTSQEKETLVKVETEVKTLEAGAAAPPALSGAFSSDSGLVVIGGGDHTVRAYQTTQGSPLANLTGASAAWGLVTSAENELLSVTADGRVVKWDLQLRWALEHAIGTPEESPFSDRVTALDFSPNGRWLAVGSGPPSRAGEVLLIDVPTATVAKNLGEVHSDTVLCLRFSPDGRQLASGGADKLCRLWQVENGQPLRAFEGHTHHVLGLAWHNNGQRLATAGADQSIKIWKVESGEQERTIAGFGHEVTSVEFVGDTPQLISVCADGKVKLLNSDDGKTVREFAGASDALYSVAISADGKKLTAGGQAGKVWSWNVEDGKLIEPAQAK